MSPDFLFEIFCSTGIFCISHEFKLHEVRVCSVLFTIILVTSAILTGIETCLLSKHLWNEWMMNIAFTLNFVNQYCNLSSFFFFFSLLGHCKKKSVAKLAINSQVYRLKFKFLHFALKKPIESNHTQVSSLLECAILTRYLFSVSSGCFSGLWINSLGCCGFQLNGKHESTLQII